MPKLLITGSSGFVGAYLLEAALSAWDVHAAFFQHPPHRTADVTVHAADFRKESDIEHLLERVQPDAVIHAAAMSNIDACQKQPDQAFRLNATAAEVLAELSVQYGFRLVFVSTDMVFDGDKGGYTETDRARPLNMYGTSKITAEKFIRAVCQNWVIARSSLVYGPSLNRAVSFTDEVIRRLNGGETMPLFTDQFRTPVLVKDLAAALVELAGSRFQGIIHLGGAEKADRWSFGQRLAELKHLDSTKLIPSRMSECSFTASRPRDVSLDTSLAAEVLRTRLHGYTQGLTYV